MARRQILSEMGYDFTIMSADIDEKSIRKETPEDLVMALAEAKAEAIMSRLAITDNLKELKRPTLLLTADTVQLFILFVLVIFYCSIFLFEKSSWWTIKAL
ncbi:maf-like protein DDB_G0281937 isoform X2 [Olea europaea var. sylvestris]|nr:maf-like protein DDB_G0281937 isoform X2 [Olea europaea var. sylvestris]